MPDLSATTGLLGLLADPTRVRLMALLCESELTVAELTRITRLSQSRVSTHLGKLRDAGFLRDRRVGTSTFYTVSPDLQAGQGPAHRLWTLMHAELDDALLSDDHRRLQQVVHARDGGQPWPDAVAGRMERYYSPGRTWEATARGFLGLMRLGHVLDVGSGDGVLAGLLALRAMRITCLDRSTKVLEAAKQRLAAVDNVQFAAGDMHELPFADGAFDQVLLFNVLTYAHTPTRAIEEAHRVLVPGGDVAIVTLRKHHHVEVSKTYHHVNQGFVPNELAGTLRRAGFEVDLCEVTSRERRKPYFEVLSAFARKA